MDQNAMVGEPVESGRRLIEAVGANGFEVRVAFWAKPTEDGKWYLYLASPFVDEKGLAEAYRLVLGVLRTLPDLWLDPFEVKVIGVRDSLAQAALAAATPPVSASPSAPRRPRPNPGMLWYRESTLGRVSIDGAYIYLPAQSGAGV